MTSLTKLLVVVVKIVSFSSKSSHQQRPATALSSFAAETVNFEKNDNSNYQSNEDVLHDFQGAAAVFFWRELTSQVPKVLDIWGVF